MLEIRIGVKDSYLRLGIRIYSIRADRKGVAMGSFETVNDVQSRHLFGWYTSAHNGDPFLVAVGYSGLDKPGSTVVLFDLIAA